MLFRSWSIAIAIGSTVVAASMFERERRGRGRLSRGRVPGGRRWRDLVGRRITRIGRDLLRSSKLTWGSPIGSWLRHTSGITSLHCSAVSRLGRREHCPGRVLRTKYPFAYSLRALTASRTRRPPPPAATPTPTAPCLRPASEAVSDHAYFPVFVIQALYILDVRVHYAEHQRR